MSAAIEIELQVRYVQCLLADALVESRPVLRVFPDGHFDRRESLGGVATLRLDENRLNKQYQCVLKARAPLGAQPIPLTAAVGFASCAERRNEFGVSCATSAGNTHLRMADLIKMHSSGEERKLPLLLEPTRLTGEPVCKGVIAVRVTRLQLGDALKWAPLEHCLLGDNMVGECAEELGAFLDRRIQFESSLKDTWSHIKNVRAPMDISAAGIELTKSCFVPIEGFAMVDPLEVNVGYFQNAMERAMIRRNLNPETDFDALDLAHKAELAGEIISYAAQYCDYIGDSVDRSVRGRGRYNLQLKVAGEDFTNAGTRFSGDCEDVTKFIQTMKYAFDEIDVSTNNERLKELQHISRQYGCFMTLATVHGAKAEDQTEHIGAHLYCLLLPKPQVKRALMTNALGRAMATQLPLQCEVKGLPTLFCEGTGRIKPLGPGPGPAAKALRAAHADGLIGDSSNHPIVRSHDPLINARRYVASMLQRSRGGLKTEIPHDRGAPSSFYLGNLLLVTNDYMQYGHNVGAFICGNVDPAQGGITRGAFFTDIINQHPNFAIVPCEPLPDRIMAITREAALLREPVPPYVFDRTKPLAGPVNGKEPALERLKSAINGLGRQGVSPFSSVDLFARPHQFNQASIDIMIGEIKEAEAIYRVDYEKEHITNNLYGYRIRLFVDENMLHE
jgi:hypothetical protein